MVTPFAQQALDNLRSNDNFVWYIIPLMVIVMYIYSKEIKRALETNNWNVVSAGLALFGMDIINEVVNALIFHYNQYAALWMTPGDSVYIILIGWNIEIAFMFSIAGIVFGNTLPEDRNLKILGLNNRWALAIGFSAFAVFVEVLLNHADALIWEFDFWTDSLKGIWLIFFLGYFHFFIVSFWVHDMENKNKIKVLSIIYTIGLGSLIIFMGFLKYI